MIFERIDKNEYSITEKRIKSLLESIENVECEKKKNGKFYFIRQGIKVDNKKEVIVSDGFVGRLY